MTLVVGVLSLAVWVYLLLARGAFWQLNERDDRREPKAPLVWPSVVAVVPARNEADVIARSLGSLAAQDYGGPFQVILVDDNSEDGTAQAAGGHERVQILSGTPVPSGWTGKLWAMNQGADRAATLIPPPDYILFTDADIAHAPDTLSALAARAEAGGLALTSLMAELTVRSWAERLLIPAFVFFFDMLYPFAWANDPGRGVAAAAGGCMLVRREALAVAGGLEAIRSEIIDDCALARLMKRQGPIWLGFTHRARSLRPYESFAAIGAMVSRSAYAQLRFSPWLLAATVLGMAIVYLVPPALALFGRGTAEVIGFSAWLMMAIAFAPICRFYRLSPLLGAALPLIGAIYTVFTVQSAVESWRGRGGMWKGRPQAVGMS